MPKVKLAAVVEGMVVSADVRNMDNMLLIPAGCILTEKHIDILNAWGVAELQVETGSTPEEDGDILKRIPPESLQKVRVELTAIFWEPSEEGTVQEEIFDLVLRRKVQQMVNPKTHSYRREH
jgi:hypothetical protein